jgi:hypothetical protein
MQVVGWSPLNIQPLVAVRCALLHWQKDAYCMRVCVRDELVNYCMWLQVTP